MTWAEYHSQSETLAVQAKEARDAGQNEVARDLYCRAATLEARAMEALAPSKARTLGITAISSVALWYKGDDLESAEAQAYRAQTQYVLPAFAQREIRALLQAIWNKEAQLQSGLAFAEGQILVSVKGGEILSGGAPLDLIVAKAQGVQSLLLRTVEYLAARPLRRRGGAPKDLLEQFRPWIFQSVPGSYQFSISLQEPRQMDLFPRVDVEPEAVTDKLMAILRAGSDGSDERLREEIASDEYRATFKKMIRALAPSGKSFEKLEIGRSSDVAPVVLSAEVRQILLPPQVTLAALSDSNAKGAPLTLRGTLRALHLDNDWIDVLVDGQPVHISHLTDVVDDVIGPMVNHEVSVRVFKGKGKQYRFLDIDLAE